MIYALHMIKCIKKIIYVEEKKKITSTFKILFLKDSSIDSNLFLFLSEKTPNDSLIFSKSAKKRLKRKKNIQT